MLQDVAKALKYFSLAADQGWVDGQLQLALMHYGKFSVLCRKLFLVTHKAGFSLYFC